MPLVLQNGTTVGVIMPNGTVVKVVPPGTVVSLVAVPVGASSAVSEAFEFTQASPSASWDIALPGNFPARRPGVTLYDISNNEIESDVIWSPSTKHINVVFPSPVTGYAVIT